MARENINHKVLLLKWFEVDEFNYDLVWVEKIEYLKKILKFVPFLKQVGVCNSITMGVAGDGSDIDLFVVSKPNRVYLVRFWMVLLFHILGKRRYGDKIEGRFCLSFFVDENHIDMSDIMIEDDYYFQFWVQNIWWLLDNEEFLSNWRNINKLPYTQRLFNWSYRSKDVLGSVWNTLNYLVGVLQRIKAHKSYKNKNFPKGVLFEEGIIKCHDQDIRWDFRRFIDSFQK